MDFTHKRIARFAHCIQFSDKTTQEILTILGPEASLYDKTYIVIRAQDKIYTLRMGDWVIIGENCKIKVYKEEEFRTKYENI